MEGKKDTTWCETETEMPTVDSQCPKCGGQIADSQYGGVWCKGCKWKWKKSKFPPRKKGQTKGTEKIIEEHNQGEIIIKKLNQILYLITGINVDSNPEEFKEIMEKVFGKGIIK